MITDIEGATIYRSTTTGLAFVQDKRTGFRHTCHPNLRERGSLTGATPGEWWGAQAQIVKFNGYLYNVSITVEFDPLDAAAARFCECQGCLARKTKPNDLEALTRLLQRSRDTMDLVLAGEASLADVADTATELEKWLWGVRFLEEIKEVHGIRSAFRGE